MDWEERATQVPTAKNKAVTVVQYLVKGIASLEGVTGYLAKFLPASMQPDQTYMSGIMMTISLLATTQNWFITGI